MTAQPASATRVCRFCEATIPAAARVCPECHKDITGRDTSIAAPAAATIEPLPLGPMPVSLVDINLPFESMVWFMVKWAVAAIPAFLMLAAIAFAVALVFGLLFGGLARLAS